MARGHEKADRALPEGIPYYEQGRERVTLPFALPFWVISDTHFLHARINEEFEACRAALGRSTDVDELMIERWREVVGPEDTVIHLGDLALGKREDFAPISARLPGRKLMLRTGNHDRRTKAWYAEHGFVLIPEFWLPYRGWRVRFTHRPDDARAFTCHPRTLNAHGHTHSKTREDRRLINLSVEAQGFRPRLASDVLDERLAELAGGA
jgi:calcineurin-like phosphoesterase family protein